jgi:hypothetical protein
MASSQDMQSQHKMRTVFDGIDNHPARLNRLFATPDKIQF